MGLLKEACLRFGEFLHVIPGVVAVMIQFPKNSIFMKHLNSRITQLSLLILLFVFTSINVKAQPDKDFEISKNLEIFSTLYKQLHLNYVDDINPGELMKTGMDAMLESLDPYTVYIPESDIEDYKIMTLGQYGGIGALIHQRGSWIYISDPYEGFPATKVGLISGDKILEVNGKSAKDKKVEEISNMLKGQAGSSIKLLIEREGISKPIEKEIVREEIKIDNIPYFGMINDHVGYIKLTGFTQNASKEVQDAFLKLKEKNMKALIFDLRGNGGGLLQEAVNIVNLFVEKDQLVVSTKGKIEERNAVHKTSANPIDKNIPIIFLVDRYSASASEIVSGAIQDLDRGVILGQKTFGKGLVQNVYPLSYNAQMKVTIAKYYIPSGRCIQALDYSHKKSDGSPERVADSLRNAFKTKNGRMVYDGGGIEPDIAMENETLSNISVSLITKYLVFDYASKFKRENPILKDTVNFSVTDAIYTDFINFLKGKDYDYTTQSESKLNELKKAAENEKYFEAIKPQLDALREKLIHDKEADLMKFKEEIIQLLKEEIISRYAFQKGRIKASLASDKEIAKAVEVLDNTQLYKSILDGSYKKSK